MVLIPLAGLTIVVATIFIWLAVRGRRSADLGAVSQSWIAQQRAASSDTDR
jgi:hypothetical protein